MSRADAHLEYLRSELRACEYRAETLRILAEGSETRRRFMEEYGSTKDQAALAEIADQGAEHAAAAYRKNREVAAEWRRLIAEHLAQHTHETVQPIRAHSDDAAIFDLLASVGCRMPGGVR